MFPIRENTGTEVGNKVKKTLFILAVLVMLALIGRYQNLQYDAQYRDLTIGREVTTTTVYSLEGVDAVMNRALGEDRNKYSLEIKREVFHKMNGNNEMLQEGQQVKVPGPIKKIKLARN